jgi:hypothetical protein
MTEIDPKIVAWARRKLRERGLGPDDPVTWTIEYHEGKRPDRDPETFTMGMARDPFDAIATAEVIAYAHYWETRHSPGRWKAEWLGEEGTTPDYLIVIPHDDPAGGLPLTDCLP